MKKILLIDSEKSFIVDLNRRILINDRQDLQFTIIEKVSEIESYMSSQPFDMIVTCAKLIEGRDWQFNIPVRAYAKNEEELELAKANNIKCYGIIKGCANLIEEIDNDDLSNNSEAPISSEKITNVLTEADMPEHLKKSWEANGLTPIKDKDKDEIKEINEAENQNNTVSQQTPQMNMFYQNQQYMQGYGENQTTAYPQPSVSQEMIMSNKNESPKQLSEPQQSEGYPKTVELPQNQVAPQMMLPATQPQYSYYPSFTGQAPSFVDKQGNPIYQVIQAVDVSQMQYMIQGTAPQTTQTPNIPTNQSEVLQKVPNTQTQNTNQNNQIKQKYSATETEGIDENIFASENITTQSQKLQYKATDRFKKAQEKEYNQTKSEADMSFEDDMGNVKHDAKCFTVYSSKGGVGKTTVSCELASFLALTSHGRGKYKVCIVDFNIDFGDVLNTLAFSPRGANMTTWVEDIKMRISRGEKPENITYTKEEMSVWLQKKEETGLYALLAPTSNVDSMNIGEDEIRIMLDNLVKNGDFDFVICDTGNNTRDSSFIALEKADTVLLVLTQDVNTANCNNSFLKTAERVGFDMDKIKLVINKVMPTKIVGIAPEELETAFIDEKTRRPYKFETLAKIKHSNDAINCGNKGEPLIYNSSHEFTRSIGEMVSKLTGQERVLAAPEKEGFFKRLFKKPQ